MSSSPSKPVNIVSPRLRPRDSLDELENSESPAVVRTPDRRALRAQFGTPPPNIPPRTRNDAGAGASGNSSPGSLQHPANGSGQVSRRVSLGGISQRRPPDTPPRADSPFNLDDLPDDEKARIVRKHLVSRQERQNRLDRRSPAGSDDEDIVRQLHPQREESDAFPIPFSAPGGDVTHDIYKWQAGQQRQAATRSRAASFAGPPASVVDPAFEHIHQPGGFRRNYMLLKANEQGVEEPPRMVNNFIEFLYLFGHFGGEDLEEDEDDLEAIPEEDEGLIYPHAGPSRVEAGLVGAEGILSRSQTLQKQHISIPSDVAERTPSLARTASSRSISRSKRRRRSSIGPHGDATVTQAVLMLLKSFIGTGVLFLGKAFFNGGILFSSLTIIFIAAISLYSFLLLIKTKFVVSGSFGDIGGTLYGPWMRFAILSSITVSQIGFVSAYTIFVAENIRAFIMAVTRCARVIPVQYLILAQLVVILPAALVRNLAKLSTTALVADAFILAGLLYIFGSETALIANRGVAEVALFNPKDFPLLIGTAVFSFEGIGLVIPITDAMREPRKFPAVLTGVMIFLTVLFAGAGALAYATFGSDIQTVVIVNLNGRSKLVQAVQFLYSMAILLSIPLQLFPAVRIMENGLFTSSGKGDPKVKWQKNFFRFSIVVLCSAISAAGAQDLDKFVAFIGSFACVPLCYVYPAMLHYRACARTWRQKVADIALMIFGTAAAIYTTVQTIRLMVAPGSGDTPQFGICENPPDGVGRFRV